VLTVTLAGWGLLLGGGSVYRVCISLACCGTWHVVRNEEGRKGIKDKSKKLEFKLEEVLPV